MSNTDSLHGRCALVTGASGGIGRAIAVALAEHGASVCVVGRNSAALADVAKAVQRFSTATLFHLDLTGEKNIDPLVKHVQETGKLEILVHAAGIISQRTMERASVDDLDRQYAINVRAPYLLSQRLLPSLIAGRGQIVFINSSVALSVKRPDIGQYAATKHALRAIADSLREEVNPKGVRVLTVYLGRTATPMQRALHSQEGKMYRPETLLQPEDVAAVVVELLMLPVTAEVTEISIRPANKP
jgi:NAD(P)-dependent dehydrogenase (short-subunit alcohol dehydrogenase family)